MSNELQDRVAHLYRRAAWGAGPAEMAFGQAQGVDSVLESLLSGQGVEPPDIGLPIESDQMGGAWMKHLVATPKPLHEKMTLFWHNHFATAYTKVQHPQKMTHQMSLFRRYALGNFRDLLHEVAMDPAMLVWLDGIQNTKGAPNENFARELMELFSLGPGHYTEKDVQESARAFTGWGLPQIRTAETVRYEDRFLFDVAAHDFGYKTFLGVRGRLGGHQVVDLVLKQPAAPRFIARKLLVAFVRHDPDPDLVETLAAVLLKNDWELRPTMSYLFRSDAFWSDRARFALIKSPIEFVVGFAKHLDLPKPPGQTMARNSRLMGQELLNPPSVKGWAGGRSWLNSFTYLKRFNFAGEVVADRGTLSFDRLSAPLIDAGVSGSGAVVDWFLDRLGPLDVSAGERSALATYLDTGNDGKPSPFKFSYVKIDRKLRGLVQLIAAMPQYQMN